MAYSIHVAEGGGGVEMGIDPALRIRSMDQLHNILVVLSCAAVTAYCVLLYRGRTKTTHGA